MRALAGIWKTGMTSKMFQKKMKKNSESRKGVALAGRPGPMVCMMIRFSMKSTADLGEVLRPRRHELPLAAPATKNSSVSTTARQVDQRRPC